VASRNGSVYFIFDRDEVTLSACCRLRTTIQDNYMLRHPESLRFCGFQNVTVNIPQCMYRAARAGQRTYEGLVAEIDKMMELAVKAHEQKRARIAEMISAPGFPLWQIGKMACDGKPYVELDKATYIIGLIGVNDAVKFLIGKEFHEAEEALRMGEKLIAHMFLRCKKLSVKHKMKLTLEESPAESAARRLAKADLVYYRDEALQVYKGGNEDVAYYTNSVHLSPMHRSRWSSASASRRKFHSLIESGAITHAFIGEERPSPGAIETLMRETFFRTQSAQVTLSPEFTYCLDCGHNMRGLKDRCTTCGSAHVEGETRVVGYFSKINNWNKSKREGELPARQRGLYAVEAAAAVAGPRRRNPAGGGLSHVQDLPDPCVRQARLRQVPHAQRASRRPVAGGRVGRLRENLPRFGDRERAGGILRGRMPESPARAGILRVEGRSGHGRAQAAPQSGGPARPTPPAAPARSIPGWGCRRTIRPWAAGSSPRG
jgi:anaerobic ribonucleoside-triphosphate reductase